MYPRLLSRIALLLMVILISGMVTASVVVGQAAPPPQTPPVQKIKVSAYILRLGQFDLATSSYLIDFYLNFTCDSACDPSSFEIMNGQELGRQEYDQTPTNWNYRIQALLTGSFDLHKYPFDSHDLSILIEDGNATVDSLVYEPDANKDGLDNSIIIAGLNLHRPTTARVIEHYYPNFDETYSQYVFTLHVERPVLSGILKGILPALFILIIGFMCFLIAPQRVSDRIMLSTSSLIGSVLYHLSLTSAIPPVGYMTFADTFMSINYIGLIGTLGFTLGMIWCTDHGREDIVQGLHRVSSIITLSLWVILQGINIWTTFGGL